MKKWFIPCTLMLLFIGITIYNYRHTYVPHPKPPSFILGTYRWFNGDEGVSLTLEADGTFTSTKHTDVGPPNAPSHIQHGIFWLEGNKVMLENLTSETPKYIYLAIPWGKRMYLIPETEIVTFMDSIRQGLEPRRKGALSPYFLRDKGAESLPTGLPELPPKWRSHLKAVHRP